MIACTTGAFFSPRLTPSVSVALGAKCRVRLSWLIKRLLCRLNPWFSESKPAPLPATLHLIRWSGPYTSETSPQVMFVTLTISFLPLFYNRTHIPGYVGLLLLLLLFLLRYRLADVLTNMVALISCSMTWTVCIVWLAEISVKKVAL